MIPDESNKQGGCGCSSNTISTLKIQDDDNQMAFNGESFSKIQKEFIDSAKLKAIQIFQKLPCIKTCMSKL